jgi:hypothetical protein
VKKEDLTAEIAEIAEGAEGEKNEEWMGRKNHSAFSASVFSAISAVKS